MLYCTCELIVLVKEPSSQDGLPPPQVPLPAPASLWGHQAPPLTDVERFLSLAAPILGNRHYRDLKLVRSLSCTVVFCISLLVIAPLHCAGIIEHA